MGHRRRETRFAELPAYSSSVSGRFQLSPQVPGVQCVEPQKQASAALLSLAPCTSVSILPTHLVTRKSSVPSEGAQSLLLWGGPSLTVGSGAASLIAPSSLRQGNDFLSVWKASPPWKHPLRAHCYCIKGPQDPVGSGRKFPGNQNSWRGRDLRQTLGRTFWAVISQNRQLGWGWGASSPSPGGAGYESKKVAAG